MFDKRLFALVDGVGALVAVAVALKWVALAADIVLIVSLGLFIQRALLGIGAFTDVSASVLFGMASMEAPAMLGICALAIAVRFAAAVGLSGQAAPRPGVRRKASAARCTGSFFA